MIENKRPTELYYFSDRTVLERALSTGEFRLHPPVVEPSLAAATVKPAYLVLSLTTTWDGTLFDAVTGIDACLIIRNTEEFGERLHRAVQKTLPNWAGIDAPVVYGAQSPLGKVFSRPKAHARENEWRFAWRPMQAHASVNPVTVRIGSIEDIAELQGSRH